MRKFQFRMRDPVLARGKSARFSIPLISRANFDSVWKPKRKVCWTDWGVVRTCLQCMKLTGSNLAAGASKQGREKWQRRRNIQRFGIPVFWSQARTNLFADFVQGNGNIKRPKWKRPQGARTRLQNWSPKTGARCCWTGT